MHKRLFPIVLVFTLIAVAAQAQEFVTDGLVSFWSFDRSSIIAENVRDLWGHNNGTIEGNPEIVAGKVNEALFFDGVVR